MRQHSGYHLMIQLSLPSREIFHEVEGPEVRVQGAEGEMRSEEAEAGE